MLACLASRRTTKEQAAPEANVVEEQRRSQAVAQPQRPMGRMAYAHSASNKPRQKPTLWRSSGAPKLSHSPSVRWDGRRPRIRRLAGRYPPAMIAAIVRGIQAQCEEDTRARLEAPLEQGHASWAAAEQTWSEKVVKNENIGETVQRGKVGVLEVPRARIHL